MVRLYNSLTKKVGEFTPLHQPKVGLYTCGPTVYDFDHIGHARKYVHDDILRRVLVADGFEVTHVQNITDVGHLVSDSDEGEDKFEKGARKYGKTVWEVADFFTKHFQASMHKLNNLAPAIICKATEHIAEQIALIVKLVDKGYAYDTEEAVYFDVAKFPHYTKLFGQNLADKKTAVRDEVETGSHKKHPADFALWFKRVGRFVEHTMHWDSPWGDGFPGWHIECSAMSMKYLGETVDIHTGGIDHLPVHHPNEIAQSEAVTGKQFVRFWVHHGWLLVDNSKMSKSLNNFYRIEDVEAKGFSALDLRYFYLTAHYRSNQNFTFEALNGAKASREKLVSIMAELLCNRGKEGSRTMLSDEKLQKVSRYSQAFADAVNDDLNMPQALAVMWEVVKSNIPSQDKLELVSDFDAVLGLNLRSEARRVTTRQSAAIPDDIAALARKRDQLRKSGKWTESDAVRVELEGRGYQLKDTPDGTIVAPR